MSRESREGGRLRQQSVKHYEDAQCMTDQLAAPWRRAGDAERTEVLGKFYESAGNSSWSTSGSPERPWRRRCS